MRMALVKLALATGVGLVTLAACGSANDGYDPSVPTAVEYLAGSGQSGEVMQLLPELLTVKTTNIKGDPVGGVTVQWYVQSGGGNTSTGTSVTDVNGVAQVSWVLGPSVGTQVVQAVSGSLTGSPVNFGATANPGSDGGGGGGATPLMGIP